MFYLILYLFLLSLVFPVFHIISSMKGTRFKELVEPKDHKSFSLIVPCYNEENLVESIKANFSSLHYPNHEILIINDGSSDNTLRLMLDALSFEASGFLFARGDLSYNEVNAIYRSKTYPNIFLIDKKKGGKADSINAGVDHATSDYVITLDADSFLKSDALSYLNQSFQDDMVVAVGGNVQVVQSVKQNGSFSFAKMNLLLKLQTMEYLKGFYILKQSLANNNALSIISGAFGAFKRQTLIDVGGFRKTIGEDMDITMKIQQHIAGTDQKLVFQPQAVCYTEIPNNYRDFFNQRVRWQKAFVDCLFIYLPSIVKRPFRNRFSFFFFFDSFNVGLLATLSTFIFLMYTMINPTRESLMFLLAFFVTTSLLNIVYNVSALVVSRRLSYGMTSKEYLNITLVFLLDVLFYRFFNIIVIVIGTVLYFFNRHSWNKVSRSKTVYNFIP